MNNILVLAATIIPTLLIITFWAGLVWWVVWVSRTLYSVKRLLETKNQTKSPADTTDDSRDN